MVLSLVILALGSAVLVPLVLLMRRQTREAEEHAARTLARLRRHHEALADRTAETGSEVTALYHDASNPDAHPRPHDR